MTLLSEPSFVRATANIATALFALFIGIQLLIATGLLPVSIVWGGRQTELTPALRLASVAAAVILGVFIYIIRYRAGLVGSVPVPAVIQIGAWGVTAYMAFNTLGNFVSVNTIEKMLFGPITFMITIACLLVSVSNLD